MVSSAACITFSIGIETGASWVFLIDRLMQSYCRRKLLARKDNYSVYFCFWQGEVKVSIECSGRRHTRAIYD